MMKASELIVRCLEHEDAHWIFGVPGEETLELTDALLDSRIRIITTRHEQGAAFMADVYGRLTGKAGVCFSTLGPGATNLLTALAPDDVVICDVGAHKLWMARMYPCELPNTCVISNGFASMGIGLPGAVAAKLACPARTVVTVTGDGGFLMNVQELETAVRYGTPLIVPMWRDDAYGVIRWNQMIKFGRPAAVDFGNPDIPKLAESFGAVDLRVSDASELKPCLAQAFNSDRTVVIDCPVDYSENLKLTERLRALAAPQGGAHA